MNHPNPFALLALLPLVALLYRVSHAPYRSGHFLFEYAVFLLHALLSLVEGDTTLALLPPVAVVSYLLYWSTREHERVFHVVCSVCLVAITTELAVYSPVVAGCVMAPQVLIYTASLARFVRSWRQSVALVVLAFAAVLSIALTEPGLQWGLRSFAYALALLLCPTERVLVPHTPVELVLQQAMEAAASNEEEDDDVLEEVDIS